MIYRFPYELPRNAFSHRDAARAGDVWRAFQDIAVGAASRAGWPPRRLREAGTTFVVRSMTVVHHRETAFGERLEGVSWVRRFRRETLCTREVRLFSEESPVASATQEWVHVDGEGKPARASREMADSFGAHDEGGVELPEVSRDEVASPCGELAFEPWHVWMDPLNHVNHPAYVDYCDESLARAVASNGIDPAEVVPIAESVTFFAPLVARDRVIVRTTRVGRTAQGDTVLEHVIDTRERPACARAITVRRFASPSGPTLDDVLARAREGAEPS